AGRVGGPLLMALVPVPEAVAAPGVQGLVVGEPQLPVLRQRLVEFAPVVGVIAADLRTLLVDAAAPAGLEVPAGAHHEHVPAAFILEELDVVVGDLPEHEIEVIHRTRRLDFLRHVVAAQRVGAMAAFLLAGERRAIELDRDGRKLAAYLAVELPAHERRPSLRPGRRPPRGLPRPDEERGRDFGCTRSVASRSSW